MHNDEHIMSDDENSPKNKHLNPEESKENSTLTKDDSSESDEEMYDSGKDLFCQELYMFLFDENLKISQRKGFKYSDLSASDFQKMIHVNRSFLVDFLQLLMTTNGIQLQILAIVSQLKIGEIMNADGSFEDDKIHFIWKSLLQIFEFGFYLKDHKVSGHLEYFMNTLSYNIEPDCPNPFKDADKYPAFQFKAQDEVDLKDQNLALAPNRFDDDVSKGEPYGAPQIMVDEASDYKANMSSKTFDDLVTGVKSIKVDQDDLRRSSQVFVRRMSVLQQHQMVIAPVSFSKTLYETISNVKDQYSKKQKKEIFTSVVKESVT